MDALTPARLVLRLPLQNERQPSNRQVSLLHMTLPSMHSVTTHLARPIIAFMLPTQRDGFPIPFGFGLVLDQLRYLELSNVGRLYRSELRPESESSLQRTAESCSLSYGLHVRLWLLSTPSRDDAVTFGYRERASPERGLAPLRLRLLAGARIPASAGMTISHLQ